MNFTDNSKKLINNFLNDFDKYGLEKTSKQQQHNDMIFKSIFNDISMAESYIKKIEELNLIKKTIKEVTSKKDLPKCSLWNGKYIPKHISLYISNNTKGYFKLNCKISSININIYFLFFSDKDFLNMNTVEKKLKFVLKVIKFMSYYINKANVNNLDIFLALTNFKKELPKNQISTIGQDNCNSAVTYACAKNGELLVFRKEEWKKVLIHELFHSLCFDFSGINYTKLKDRIKGMYKIKSEFDISESYSEFWATILNCCFTSYELIGENKERETFLLYTEFCIRMETIFSLFQAVKILNYMSLVYENLYKDDEISKNFRNILYKEETNVFAYYILKCLMLFFNYDFIEMCNKINTNMLYFDKTPLNLKSFGDFILVKYDHPLFLSDIKNMELFHRRISGGNYTKPKRDYVNKTMRMTVCEVDL